MLLLLAFGCDEIDALFGGITDRDVADGLVMGVQAPPDMDLSGTEYATSGRAAAYLTTLGGAPPEATLTLTSPTNGVRTLNDEGEGVWATAEEEGIHYVVGETIVLQRDGSEILRAEAAPPAGLTLAGVHPLGSALAIDASDRDYDALLAVVLDLESGETRWTNGPSDAEAVQSMLLEEPELAFDIPADAFPAAGHYAVGVAGLRANAAVDVTDVNTLTSVMATGVLELHAVTVTDGE